MIKLSLSHNFGLKIVSLIAGIAVFLYVKSFEVPKETNTRQVPLSVTGLGPDMQVVSIPDTVNVTIRAPFEVMERLNLNSLSLHAYVDLENAEPGEREYTVGLDRPRDIKELEWEWDRTVPVVLDQILEQPRPVTVVWPDGYDANAAKANVQPVTVRGPSSSVANMGAVRVVLKPSDVLQGGTFTLPVEVVDREGRPMTGIETRPSSVSVSIVTGQTLPKRDILISPRFTGQPRFGYFVQSVTVEPASVTVQGDRKAIIALSTLSTEPIRLEGLRQPTEIKTRLILPDGISLVEDVEVTVRVRISKS